ncbi:hypothetical protein [Shewanella algae]
METIPGLNTSGTSMLLFTAGAVVLCLLVIGFIFGSSQISVDWK